MNLLRTGSVNSVFFLRILFSIDSENTPLEDYYTPSLTTSSIHVPITSRQLTAVS